MKLRAKSSSITATFLVAIVLAGCGGDGESSSEDGEQSITVQLHGGSWREQFEKHVVTPFEEETGIQVSLVEGTNTSALNSLRATGGENPQYDLAVLSKLEIRAAVSEDLLQPVDTSRVAEWDNLNVHLYEGGAGLVVDDEVYAVPTVVGRIGMAYRTDKLTEPPTSWMSVFKDEDLQGHIGLLPPSNTAAGVGFLLEVADELGFDTSQPESISKAIEELAFLKGHVSAFPPSNATVDKLLTTGDVWVAPAFDGRALVLQETGAPVGFAYSQEAGSVAYGNPFVIPTGVDDLDPVYEFIDYMTHPDFLGAFGSAMYYGVANDTADYTDEAEQLLQTGPDSYENLIWSDPEMIADHNEEWQSVWNATFK